MFGDNSELERLYYYCDYHAALRLSSVILKTDPHHPACLPVHVTLLVELENTHSLVDRFTECVTWYAVGRSTTLTLSF